MRPEATPRDSRPGGQAPPRPRRLPRPPTVRRPLSGGGGCPAAPGPRGATGPDQPLPPGRRGSGEGAKPRQAPALTPQHLTRKLGEHARPYWATSSSSDPSRSREDTAPSACAPLFPPRPLPPGPGAPTAHLPSWLGASRTARAAPPPDGSSGSRNRGRGAQRAARAGEGPDARPQEARPGSTGGGGAAGSPQRGTWPLRAQLRAPRGSPPMPAPLPAGPQRLPRAQPAC